jgi:hypothetical protein
VKLYVGIIHNLSTSAKQKAQLQNTWHNYKNNCTTAKKMHNGNFPLPSRAGNDTKVLLLHIPQDTRGNQNSQNPSICG